MDNFVHPHSIVRKIWGNADVVLFIFAGAAAEFSLNKAVDWLYFTGKLPKDPLGRLFSTVAYAKNIVFSSQDEANSAIDQITAIHQQVENSRAAKIPDWAYRDVLFMLIYYSIAAFEALERKLTLDEKEEIFTVFNRVGTRMQINGLPDNFANWRVMHAQHLEQNLMLSLHTADLFEQYRKNLGLMRYRMMKTVQGLIVPTRVKKMLLLRNNKAGKPLISLYRFLRKIGLQHLVVNLLLPYPYKGRI